MKRYLLLMSLVSVVNNYTMNPTINYKDNTKLQLITSLQDNSFDAVVNLLHDNPKLLHDNKNPYIDQLFARKFVTLPPQFLNSKLGDGLTPDQLALIRKNNNAYDYMKKLVHVGFDLDVRGEDGMPLLCQAILYTYDDRYLELLKGGARVNVYDNFGNTPLAFAVFLDHPEKVSKLLAYGAVVNINTYQIHLNSGFQILNTLLLIFWQQKCILCNTHNYDLYNIPCVNRHLEHFLCINCYKDMEYEYKKCPLCRRNLDKEI
ncbi:MAG TPA: ankyrin repeat domain-containing protein [Candidatus Babeliales bacterium]|nr:ankyrin repeat domain-containing protein [Candidatus Babeliales bacterium]